MKFLIIVLLAVSFAANAKAITLVDLLKAYEQTNEIGDNAMVATQALYIPMSLKACSNSVCDSICRAIGFQHGSCLSPTTCHCYN